MNIKGILIVLGFTLVISCINKEKNNYFRKPEVIKKDIKLTSLIIDTIKLDSIQSSYVGFGKIFADSIYFIDKMFCKVYKFDIKGNHYNTYLKAGKGPKELPAGKIQGCNDIKDNKYVFFGTSFDYYIFNNQWERISNTQIDWKINNSRKEMVSAPSPDMPGLYAPSYYKLILRNYENFLYFPIISQSPNFNFINSKKYYEQGRIIAKMNMNNGKVTKLIGRYSPVYREYKYLGQFSMINFDITEKGEFFISYEPDSLIYYYNSDFKIKKVFGNKGIDMNVNYDEIITLNEFKKMYKKQRKSCGFYTWIEYIDERNLLFRNYSKGAHSNVNGLQVYRDDVLICDVEVPNGFDKIIGYIHPYFYSNIVVDEECENMKIYRFKINL